MGLPLVPFLRDSTYISEKANNRSSISGLCSGRQQVEEYGLIWIEQHSKTFVPKAEPAVTEIDLS